MFQNSIPNFQNSTMKWKIIDTINITEPRYLITTPCGQFLIGVEGDSVYKLNLKTKYKYRITGSIHKCGYENGSKNKTLFNGIEGLVLSSDCKTLYVSDSNNHAIRQICVTSGITTTFVDDDNMLIYPGLLSLSPDGLTIFTIVRHTIISICIISGKIKTFYTNHNNYNIDNFSFSINRKYLFISSHSNVKCYNIANNQFTILSTNQSHYNTLISKCNQLLYVLNRDDKCIHITNNIIDNKPQIGCITMENNPWSMTLANDNTLLYVSDFNDTIHIYNVSKYTTNFQTFIQLQLFKHSYLPQQFIFNVTI